MEEGNRVWRDREEKAQVRWITGRMSLTEKNGAVQPVVCDCGSCHILPVLSFSSGLSAVPSGAPGISEGPAKGTGPEETGGYAESVFYRYAAGADGLAGRLQYGEYLPGGFEGTGQDLSERRVYYSGIPAYRGADRPE